MAFPLLAAVLGTAGTMFASSKAASAASQQANAVLQASQLASQQMSGLAAPFLWSATYALPQMRSAIEQYLVPQAGQPSPWLSRGLDQSLQGIGRSEQAALGESQRYWAGSGNVGRGRGEALRIGRSADDARTGARLGFGTAQSDYISDSIQRLLGSLGTMGQIGAVGVNPAMGAANTMMQGQIGAAGIQGQAAQQRYGDMGELFGRMAGWGVDNYIEDLKKKR